MRIRCGRFHTKYLILAVMLSISLIVFYIVNVKIMNKLFKKSG